MTRLVAILALALAACFPEPDVGPPLAGGCEPEDSDPAVDVSFSRDVRPLFDRPGSEGGCGCHNAGGIGVQQSGFDMSSFGVLMQGGENSGRAIVVAGDPCASQLVQKLSSSPAIGARMPLSGPPFFSSLEEQLVHDWIAEGAADN